MDEEEMIESAKIL